RPKPGREPGGRGLPARLPRRVRHLRQGGLPRGADERGDRRGHRLGHRQLSDPPRPPAVPGRHHQGPREERRGRPDEDLGALAGVGERAARPEVIRKLMIANRGEIAVRVARTAEEMGIEPGAVYAQAHSGAHHVSGTGRAISRGEGTPLETYLPIPRLLAAAKESGADAVHPGYGFLSESAAFARAVEEAGLAWVGPPASAIEQMGDKLSARKRA